MRRTAFWVALTCIGFALISFPMKISQVEREGILVARRATSQPSQASSKNFEDTLRSTYRQDGQLYDEQGKETVTLATLRGIARRLDDPSFWFILATGLAGFCIAAACAHARSAAAQAKMHRIDFLRAITLFFILTCGYLISCWFKHETFFWTWSLPKDDLDGRHKDILIKWIQEIEGAGCVITIALGIWLFTIGHVLHREIRKQNPPNNRATKKRYFRSLGLLLTAGFAPLTVFGFAFSLMAVLSIANVDTVYGTFNPISKTTLPVLGLAFIALHLEVAEGCEQSGNQLIACNWMDVGLVGQFAIAIATLGAALAWQWYEVDAGPGFKLNWLDRTILKVLKKLDHWMSLTMRKLSLLP